MNGPDALWAELSRGMPTTYTGMVAQLGSTRAVAEALGVTMRTVQRRVLGEAGAVGKQVRGQSARGQAIGSAALRRAHANAQQDKQVHSVAYGTITVSGRTVVVRLGVRTDEYGDFDDVHAGDMWEAFAEGSKDGAWEAYQEGLFDAYGLDSASHGGVGFDGNEVDSLDVWFD